MTDHPWKLVAPWYRWGRQAAADGTPRARSRPVFQKFDAPDFARRFTRDPQDSLQFAPRVDEVLRVNSVPEADGKPWKRLFVGLSPTGSRAAFLTTLIATGTLKLYLPTHQRFYLVACELRCDAPGFPPATAETPCQAGFVVRRRSTTFPTGLRAEAASKVRAVHELQARLGYLDESTPLRGRPADMRTARLKQLRRTGALDTMIADAKQQLADAHVELGRWQDAKGVIQLLEGWIPSKRDGVGSWRGVEDEPQLLEESSFPLYRVFAPPGEPGHSAAGRALYYGVVPTTSLDVEPRGAARFDPDTDYEIRCFVRRHAKECPPSKAVPDCHGPLVWSRPTEPYRLAPPSDLIGTSQRPVTIRMPDLAELAALAAAFDGETLAPVRFEQPQAINVQVDDQKAKPGAAGLPQVCFFAIPLITLVAFFVLKLFLPVLVFLFNLYFLLAFKLCILPSVRVEGDAKVDLDAAMQLPEVELDLAVNVDLGDAVRAGVAIASGLEVTGDVKAKLGDFQASALRPLGKQVLAVEAIAATDPKATGAGPKPIVALQPEVRVEVEP